MLLDARTGLSHYYIVAIIVAIGTEATVHGPLCCHGDNEQSAGFRVSYLGQLQISQSIKTGIVFIQVL